jgi:hypothetical protein
MAQYLYQTEATIEYMENYLDKFHRHKEVLRGVHASKSSMTVLEGLKSSLLLTHRTNGRVTSYGTMFLRLQSGVALMKRKRRLSQKLHNILCPELGFNLENMHRMNHYSDHIRQLGNLGHVCSEPPAKPRMDLNMCTDNRLVMRPPSRFCET